MVCDKTKIKEVIEKSLKQGTILVSDFEEDAVDYIEQELRYFLQKSDSYIGANTAVRILLANESVEFLCEILKNPKLTLPNLSEQNRDRIGQTILEGFSSRGWKNQLLGDSINSKNLLGIQIYKCLQPYVEKHDKSKYRSNVRRSLDNYVYKILSRLNDDGKKLSIQYFSDQITRNLEKERNEFQEYLIMLYKISPIEFISEIEKIYTHIKESSKKNSPITIAQIFDEFSYILYSALENDDLLIGLKSRFIRVWTSFFNYCNQNAEIKKYSQTISDLILVNSIKNSSSD